MDLALSVDVVDRRELALDSVAELTLAAADGGELPTWEPGAHIDLVLPLGADPAVLAVRGPRRPLGVPRGRAA